MDMGIRRNYGMIKREGAPQRRSFPFILTGVVLKINTEYRQKQLVEEYSQFVAELPNPDEARGKEAAEPAGEAAVTLWV